MLETVMFDLKDLVASTTSLKLLLICEPESLLELEVEFSWLMIRALIPHSLKLNSDSSCLREPVEEDVATAINSL